MTEKLNKFIKIKWDHIIVVYSSWYVHIDAAKSLKENNPQAKFGFFTTDYEITAHGSFAPYDYVISNFTEDFYKKRFYKKYLFTNLNCLIYNGINKECTKKYDIIYYGRFREDRVSYFKKYFDSYIKISTTAKNVNKFKITVSNKLSFIDAISWIKGKETLNLFKFFLYIEDITTHKYFNNLANRFYEGLSCRSLPLIDISCKNTFIKSGYTVFEELFVESKDEAINKIKELGNNYKTYNKILETWDEQAKNDKNKTINEIVNFIISYKD